MTSPFRAPLDRGRIRARRVGNALRSAALVAAMALLLGVSGWIVAGSAGLMVAAFFCLFGVTVGLRSPLALVLRLVSARSLPRDGFDGLRHRIARLAQQAGLPAPPRLYYLSSPLLNAFSLGSREAAAIVMTQRPAATAGAARADRRSGTRDQPHPARRYPDDDPGQRDRRSDTLDVLPRPGAAAGQPAAAPGGCRPGALAADHDPDGRAVDRKPAAARLVPDTRVRGPIWMRPC